MTGSTRTLCLEKKEEGFSFLFYYYLKKTIKEKGVWFRLPFWKLTGLIFSFILLASHEAVNVIYWS